jgi:hypothetical protein
MHFSEGPIGFGIAPKDLPLVQASTRLQALLVHLVS